CSPERDEGPEPAHGGSGPSSRSAHRLRCPAPLPAGEGFRTSHSPGRTGGGAVAGAGGSGGEVSRSSARCSCRVLVAVLPGPAAAALDGDDAAGLEDRPAPDAPGLLAVEGALAALLDQRAVGAQSLGLLQIGGALGAEQIGRAGVVAREHVTRGLGGAAESGE